jgi:hypothetical protein
MRVTYPVLNYIRKLEMDYHYLKHSQTRTDYVGHLHKKSDHYRDDMIALYNKRGDLKRYQNRTTIDIFL